jgi:hypothetical protein
MARPKAEVPAIHLRITLTLYPGKDDRLIAFLRDQPKRGIARAIKQALLTGISPLSLVQQQGRANQDLNEALDNLL